MRRMALSPRERWMNREIGHCRWPDKVYNSAWSGAGIWTMRSSGLIELDAVLAVARHRGFRAAATELGMSRSALSHAIAALEAKLGVRLFHRTTRSVSLTEAGEQLVSGVAPALGQIREAMARAGSHRDTPAGTLRINTSAGAGRVGGAGGVQV